MQLSAKMPATMDATLPATMPATMPSDSQQTGGGGPMKAPVVPISRDSTQTDPMWVNVDDKGAAWQAEDKKLSSGWEATDRKEA